MSYKNGTSFGESRGIVSVKLPEVAVVTKKRNINACQLLSAISTSEVFGIVPTKSK